MTDRDQDWSDPTRVDRWVARDARRPVLVAAREIAVAMVGLDIQPVAVLELAGGAGTFLAQFLDAFPTARGTWSDSSREMERHARMTLFRFGDRVDYLITDMRAPGVAHASADVVVCARATHGLASDELRPFYREVAGIMRPGGWLVNLDHMPWPTRGVPATTRSRPASTTDRRDLSRCVPRTGAATRSRRTVTLWRQRV